MLPLLAGSPTVGSASDFTAAPELTLLVCPTLSNAPALDLVPALVSAVSPSDGATAAGNVARHSVEPVPHAMASPSIAALASLRMRCTRLSSSSFSSTRAAICTRCSASSSSASATPAPAGAAGGASKRLTALASRAAWVRPLAWLCRWRPSWTLSRPLSATRSCTSCRTRSSCARSCALSAAMAATLSPWRRKPSASAPCERRSAFNSL
mmetsp:Transcript_33471/g.106102  ORF Transcript_33471/g.106102 Transcript_33471/m.106102 type:complete len:210 (+) Transcript_33471:41-670(+)